MYGQKIVLIKVNPEVTESNLEGGNPEETDSNVEGGGGTRGVIE